MPMSFHCPICDDHLGDEAPNYDTVDSAIAVEPDDEDDNDGTVSRGRSRQASRGCGKKKPETRKPTSRKVVRGIKSAIIATPCGHMFHRICAERWFAGSKPATCPSCRKNCPASRILSIFPVISDEEPGQSNINNFTRQPPTGPIVSSIQFDNNGANGASPLIVIDDSSSQNGQSTSSNAELIELRANNQLLIQDLKDTVDRSNDKTDEIALKDGIIRSYSTTVEELQGQMEGKDKLIEELRKKVELCKKKASKESNGSFGRSTNNNTAQNSEMEPRNRKRPAQRSLSVDAAPSQPQAGSSRSIPPLKIKRSRIKSDSGVKAKAKSAEANSKQAK